MSEALDELDGAGPETGGRSGATALEPVPDGSADPADVLRQRLGQLVLAHPGVLRLEPTLLGAVQGLGRPTSLDGLRLTTRGGVVDLDVSVATRADRQARASVLELHQQLVDVVVEHGYVPGTVEISVLTIEEPEG